MSSSMLRSCVIEGCPNQTGRPGTARGMCGAHYNKFKKYGDPLVVKRKRNVCSIVGCGSWAHSHGFCPRHYSSFRRYADPLATSRATYEVTVGPEGEGLIPLHNNAGMVVAHTKVDPIDAEWLQRWRWSLSPSGYAYRAVTGKTILLARLLLGILDAGRRIQSDHINRDRLDNRRANLRVVKAFENAANRGGQFARARERLAEEKTG